MDYHETHIVGFGFEIHSGGNGIFSQLLFNCPVCNQKWAETNIYGDAEKIRKGKIFSCYNCDYNFIIIEFDLNSYKFAIKQI